ncbi:MAG TPA: M48 family metalloprotease [Thermoanaerobaculia bacterium]|nr:M48 family metalloprotease [Thermoanaerobaculia bacterium]
MSVQKSRWIGGVMALIVGGVTAQCSMNPATGKRQLSLVSESQEVAIGREADPQIVAQFGLYPDESVQRYVADLGVQLAAASERPDLPWTFRVLDDPLVNAFALPGGFIYVTRGILVHLESEAELVGVLGHEIGHVTARHGASQMSKAMLAQIGLVAGAIANPEAAQSYGGLAQQLAGLLFLKYGRDDERQADLLAVRYSVATGFDPNSMLGVFDTLDRVSQDPGGGSLPGWASTHPSPEDRTRRIAQAIDEAGIQRAGLEVDRAGYLQRLEGMTYGDDPRQGYFRGDTFFHPEMAFQLDFPSGWPRQNSRQSVAAVSPGRDAIVELRLARESSPEAAERSFFEQQAVRSGQAGPTRVNGLAARTREFAVVDSAGRASIVGRAAFIAHQGTVFRLLGYQRADVDRGAALTRAVESFAVLRDRARLDVQPMRIQVVRAQGGTPFSEQPAIRRSSLEASRLGLINRTDPGTAIQGGTLLKTVVGVDPSRS